MSAIASRISRIFSAAAFAEAGEHDTALNIIGEKPSKKSSRNWFANMNAAVAFAEANCHETAREFVDDRQAQTVIRIKKDSTAIVGDFAAAVGLDGVNFRFGLAQAA